MVVGSIPRAAATSVRPSRMSREEGRERKDYQYVGISTTSQEMWECPSQEACAGAMLRSQSARSEANLSFPFELVRKLS